MNNRIHIEPGSRCVDVSPSDADPLSVTTGASGIPYARMLRCVSAGTVRVTTLGGDVRNYTLAQGEKLDWVSVRQVHATGTTATVEAIY